MSIAQRPLSAPAERRQPRASSTGLLKVLYAYTIVGAGLFGVLALVAPGKVADALGIPPQDPYVFGVAGSVYAAFAIVAAVGLRAPARFAPIFLLQLGYKTLWLVLVLAPRLVRGPVPAYAWVMTAVFVSYVVLDVIAIPFPRLLEREESRTP